MKNVEKHLVGWLSICLLLCSFPVWAQGDAGDYLTIVGMVKDKQNKKALENDMRRVLQGFSLSCLLIP